MAIAELRQVPTAEGADPVRPNALEGTRIRDARHLGAVSDIRNTGIIPHLLSGGDKKELYIPQKEETVAEPPVKELYTPQKEATAGPSPVHGKQLRDFTEPEKSMELAAARDRSNLGNSAIKSASINPMTGHFVQIPPLGTEKKDLAVGMANEASPHQVIPNADKGDPITNNLIRTPVQAFAKDLLETAPVPENLTFLAEERRAQLERLEQADGGPLGTIQRPDGRSFGGEVVRGVGRIGMK